MVEIITVPNLTSHPDLKSRRRLGGAPERKVKICRENQLTLSFWRTPEQCMMNHRTQCIITLDMQNNPRELSPN